MFSKHVLRQLTKLVYWRTNYSLTLQKMIENYDLIQLKKIFLKGDMNLFCVDK